MERERTVSNLVGDRRDDIQAQLAVPADTATRTYTTTLVASVCNSGPAARLRARQ
ncbi:MAG: hypothetical protein ACYDAR_15340 [Thermomicrobiales bacterium]